MLRILKGIITKASASPALNAGLDGGYWFKRAPRTAVLPYLVIEPGTGAEIDYDTSKRYVEPVNYRFCIVGRRISEIASIVAAWRDNFNYQQMALESGHVMACKLTDEEQIDEAPTSEMRDCIQHILNFEFTQQQS